MIAGAGVCILSQHSILEYFSSFLCILPWIACNNVEYQTSDGREGEEGQLLQIVFSLS